MPFKFRKIYANNPVFIKTKIKYKKEHTYFQKYANDLSKQISNNKNNISGKGRSYADYLIRLIIFYEEFFKKEVNTLLNFKTLKEIEKVVFSKSFKKYNEDENRFPNAAFNCYISCVTHLNIENERIADLQLNESLEIVTNEENNTNMIMEGSQRRKEKIKNGNIFTYPRSREESLEAKRQSHWECDLNTNHLTFISKSNGKPYMEAHHIVPMAAQDYFENTLDFADNIVCLCPTCHRKIHSAREREQQKVLEFLFNKRKDKYYNYGIDINLKKLLNFYEIF